MGWFIKRIVLFIIITIIFSFVIIGGYIFLSRASTDECFLPVLCTEKGQYFYSGVTKYQGSLSELNNKAVVIDKQVEAMAWLKFIIDYTLLRYQFAPAIVKLDNNLKEKLNSLATFVINAWEKYYLLIPYENIDYYGSTPAVLYDVDSRFALFNSVREVFFKVGRRGELREVSDLEAFRTLKNRLAKFEYLFKFFNEYEQIRPLSITPLTGGIKSWIGTNLSRQEVKNGVYAVATFLEKFEPDVEEGRKARYLLAQALDKFVREELAREEKNFDACRVWSEFFGRHRALFRIWFYSVPVDRLPEWFSYMDQVEKFSLGCKDLSKVRVIIGGSEEDNQDVKNLVNKWKEYIDFVKSNPEIFVDPLTEQHIAKVYQQEGIVVWEKQGHKVYGNLEQPLKNLRQTLIIKAFETKKLVGTYFPSALKVWQVRKQNYLRKEPIEKYDYIVYATPRPGWDARQRAHTLSDYPGPGDYLDYLLVHKVYMEKILSEWKYRLPLKRFEYGRFFVIDPKFKDLKGNEIPEDFSFNAYSVKVDFYPYYIKGLGPMIPDVKEDLEGLDTPLNVYREDFNYKGKVWRIDTGGIHERAHKTFAAFDLYFGNQDGLFWNMSLPGEQNGNSLEEKPQSDLLASWKESCKIFTTLRKEGGNFLPTTIGEGSLMVGVNTRQKRMFPLMWEFTYLTRLIPAPYFIDLTDFYSEYKIKINLPTGFAIKRVKMFGVRKWKVSEFPEDFIKVEKDSSGTYIVFPSYIRGMDTFKWNSFVVMFIEFENGRKVSLPLFKQFLEHIFWRYARASNNDFPYLIELNLFPDRVPQNLVSYPVSRPEECDNLSPADIRRFVQEQLNNPKVVKRWKVFQRVFPGSELKKEIKDDKTVFAVVRVPGPFTYYVYKAEPYNLEVQDSGNPLPLDPTQNIIEDINVLTPISTPVPTTTSTLTAIPTPTPTPVCLTTPVSEDTFVASGLREKNFGRRGYIEARNKGRVIGLLKFSSWEDKSKEGLEVSSSTLRLKSFGGQPGFKFYATSVAGDWQEYKVNWLNKPNIGGKRGKVAEYQRPKEYSVDVKEIVKKWQGKESRSIALKGDSSGWAYFYSKENSAQKRPFLETCWLPKGLGGSLLSPSPTPTSAPEVSPTTSQVVRRCEDTFVTEDTYVALGNPTANFGGRGYLQVAEKGRLMSLLKFGNWQNRVGEGLRVDEATLTVYSFGGVAGYKLGAYGALGDWQERRVNWQNRPRIGVKGGEAVFRQVGDLEFDITSIVKEWQRGKGKSLILKGENDLPGWAYVNLYSRESKGGAFKAKIRTCWVGGQGGTPVTTPALSPTPTPTPQISRGFSFSSPPVCRVVRKRGDRADVVVNFTVTEPAPSYVVYFIQGEKAQRFNGFSNGKDVSIWLPNISKGWYTVQVEAWRKGRFLKRISSTCGIF